MKQSILAALIFLTVELFPWQITQAQGTIYVSNLGQTPTGSGVVASDAWIAQTFITGTNFSGYILNSIQLLMDAASGSPSGFTVSVYSSDGNAGPGSTHGTLHGSDPSLGGVFSYTASSLTLLPSTSYFIVLAAATPVTQGAYNWSAANSFTRDPNNWWIIDDTYCSSANGSSWTWHLRQDVFQLSIDATAVPEPSSLVLLCFGGLFLAVRLFRKEVRSF